MSYDPEYRDYIIQQPGYKEFVNEMKTAKRIAKNTPMVTYNELIGAILFYGCISFLIGLAIGWWFL